jgi:hypothetical protein
VAGYQLRIIRSANEHKVTLIYALWKLRKQQVVELEE